MVAEREADMTVTDPVCKMTLAADEPLASTIFEGRTYFFCSAACRNDFEEDPEAYLRDE
jgi:Cu+-exporting ATPase